MSGALSTNVDKPQLRMASRDVRADVQAFYDEYIALLDDGEFDAWPDLFTKECFYRITTRENAEAGYDLSLICAESAGMLRDRVRALDKTMMFGPRSYRRFLSGLRVFYDNGGIQTRGNLLVIETLVDKPSQVAFCGRFEDKLICEGGNHLLEKRLIVLDTEMIPNSLIYPL